jgi:hypothetical protein
MKRGDDHNIRENGIDDQASDASAMGHDVQGVPGGY